MPNKADWKQALGPTCFSGANDGSRTGSYGIRFSGSFGTSFVVLWSLPTATFRFSQVDCPLRQHGFSVRNRLHCYICSLFCTTTGVLFLYASSSASLSSSRLPHIQSILETEVYSSNRTASFDEGFFLLPSISLRCCGVIPQKLAISLSVPRFMAQY